LPTLSSSIGTLFTVSATKAGEVLKKVAHGLTETISEQYAKPVTEEIVRLTERVRNSNPYHETVLPLVRKCLDIDYIGNAVNATIPIAALGIAIVNLTHVGVYGAELGALPASDVFGRTVGYPIGAFVKTVRYLSGGRWDLMPPPPKCYPKFRPKPSLYPNTCNVSSAPVPLWIEAVAVAATVPALAWEMIPTVDQVIHAVGYTAGMTMSLSKSTTQSLTELIARKASVSFERCLLISECRSDCLTTSRLYNLALKAAHLPMGLSLNETQLGTYRECQPPHLSTLLSMALSSGLLTYWLVLVLLETDWSPFLVWIFPILMYCWIGLTGITRRQWLVLLTALSAATTLWQLAASE